MRCNRHLDRADAKTATAARLVVGATTSIAGDCHIPPDPIPWSPSADGAIAHRLRLAPIGRAAA
jgi:hypothetical protein